jgi:hypothetical protein
VRAKPPPRPAAPPNESPLPFAGFLDLLQRRGFTVGVDRHLRLVSLLERIDDEAGIGSLKQLITPLFATNEKEQAQFYRVFDEYFNARPARDRTAVGKPATLGKGERKATGRLRLVLTLIGVIAVGSILAIIIGSLLRTPEPNPGRNAPRPFPSAIPSNGRPGMPRPTVTGSPTIAQVAEPSPTPSRLIPFLTNNRTGLFGAAVFLPLAFFVGNEWRRLLQRRRLVLERTRARQPPFTWPIRLEPRPLGYLRSEQFYKVARQLRRRQIAEYRRLDIARTIDATIAASGYLTFQYRPDSRMPEYLILIDRASARDHQAMLFDQFAHALHREGVFVTRFFFEGDPRICWSDRATASVQLTDLQKTFSEHRLMIFGRGERLLDPVTGELAEWSSMFLDWHDRAVVTPAPRVGWNQREQTLSEQFLVFPGTLEGIEQLADSFDSSVPIEPEIDMEEEAPPDLEHNFDLEKLREYLGEPVLHWLCACAAYPELHWDLTLLIGSLPALGQNLVTEKNLLRLTRLPWFRTGAIPDERRLQLLNELDREEETAVRNAIIRVLEKSPAPQESFAWERRRLEIVLQESLLGQGSALELKTALRSASLDGTIGDYVQLSETRRVSKLAFALPEQMRSIFFDQGISALGLSFGARLGLTSAIIAAGLLSIAFLIPAGNTTAVVIGISQYSGTPLVTASSDAITFAAALRKGIGGQLIEKQSAFLYDRAARTETVKTVLARSLQERARPTDRIFYFAGYGQAVKGEKSLTFYFVDSLDNKGGRAFTSGDLMELIKPALVRGDRVFLIIDTVNAGAAGFDVNKTLMELRSAKGLIYAFLAARPDELALDSSETSKNSSPFTFFLMRGWQGAADANYDGSITLAELMNYLEYHVGAATNNEQHPLFAGNAKPDTILPPLLGPAILPVEKTPARKKSIPKAEARPTPTPPPPQLKTEITPSTEQTNPANQVAPVPSGVPEGPSSLRIYGDEAPSPSPAPSSTQSPGGYQPNEGPGGIDIESGGEVPEEARAALSKAFAAEELELRNWAAAPGNGPRDRVTVRYYFSVDERKVKKVRTALDRVLPKFPVDVLRAPQPPADYRPGHVDIWLPRSAIQLLPGAPRPVFKK